MPARRRPARAGDAGPGPSARFASVVFDVDSTLSGVEGIDWLAARRDAALAERVRALTAKAMAGELRIEEVFASRLEAVAPSRADLEALGETYVARAAPGAREALRALHGAGVRVELVSGGLRPAIQRLSRWLGVADACLHAVDLTVDARGAFAGFDRASPLTRQDGKAAILRALALPLPILAVGDGSTDLAMKTAGEADAFAAYTGFARRESVVAAADYVVATFEEVLALALPRTT